MKSETISAILTMLQKTRMATKSFSVGLDDTPLNTLSFEDVTNLTQILDEFERLEHVIGEARIGADCLVAMWKGTHKHEP